MKSRWCTSPGFRSQPDTPDTWHESKAISSLAPADFTLTAAIAAPTVQPLLPRALKSGQYLAQRIVVQRLCHSGGTELPSCGVEGAKPRLPRSCLVSLEKRHALPASPSSGGLARVTSEFALANDVVCAPNYPAERRLEVHHLCIVVVVSQERCNDRTRITIFP